MQIIVKEAMHSFIYEQKTIFVFLYIIVFYALRLLIKSESNICGGNKGYRRQDVFQLIREYFLQTNTFVQK